MKTIQQKLREILGNTARVRKHLACANLPSRSEVVKVWSQANGVIYKGQLSTSSGGIIVGDSRSPFIDPYNILLGGVAASDGTINVTLSGIPASENIDATKIEVIIGEGNNYTGLGLFMAYNFKGAGYNPSTEVLTIEIQAIDILTNVAIDLTINDIFFYLTVSHIQ